jgi:two-component sensor histidine kinase
MAGSGLLLIIAGLLYRQNRQKQKGNAIITHKNELLQKLVEEKEWLLKEVHHRVKNNLHSVICLLESQAAYLENDALKAIEESQHRIYTMSLIHQKLYQSEDVKAIDMSVYIPELVQYLSESFDTSNYINFDLMIGPIHLNASQAIPLALIINEALTNSIKYAFPGNNKGEITISLSDIGDQYKLVLADNGIGMHQNSEDGQDSLGMQLMNGLTEEIGGTISIENNSGVKITIVFGHDALNNMETLDVDNLTSATA